ncbi:MAG: hypothetical protein ABJF50_24130 [Paracoccaceae bacterium]
MTNKRKNVSSTYTEPETGKFKLGNPGRPKGSRHKSSQVIESLMQGQAEKLGKKAIDRALAGDSAALRLCLERLLPPRKDAAVEFELPTISDANEAAVAAQAVLRAVSEGNLTPTEAALVMSLVERFGRVLELAEFEDRLTAIESAIEVGAT